MSWILAEADVLQRAFRRREPDLLAVNQVTTFARERRLVIAPWVRQWLLGQCLDARNASRLDFALRAFPAPRCDAEDWSSAASHQRRARERGVVVNATQALSWAVAERRSCTVWSHDRVWMELARSGLFLGVKAT